MRVAGFAVFIALLFSCAGAETCYKSLSATEGLVTVDNSCDLLITPTNMSIFQSIYFRVAAIPSGGMVIFRDSNGVVIQRYPDNGTWGYAECCVCWSFHSVQRIDFRFLSEHFG